MKCGLEKDLKSFAPYSEERKKGIRRNVCYTCKGKKERENIKNNPERLKKHKAYLSKYYKNDPWRGKIKAYQHSDKLRKVLSITSEQFKKLLEVVNCCEYCGESDKKYLGLDRLDNKLGHEVDNVVVCCEKCNYILGDLPPTVKGILGGALRVIREENLLKEWVIPTKRHKNGN